MSLIGLCGAHRTGKTSLAKAYAKKHGIAFMETSVSAIFKELGLDPAASFDFKTRLDIQEVILERLDAKYSMWRQSALRSLTARRLICLATRWRKRSGIRWEVLIRRVLRSMRNAALKSLIGGFRRWCWCSQAFL